MAKKFYVVWQGRETGIFTDWNTCKKQVDAFAGAKYKSFKTQAEAQAAFKGNGASAGSKPSGSPAKKKTSRQAIKTYLRMVVVNLTLVKRALVLRCIVTMLLLNSGMAYIARMALITRPS